jgi:hypothetical protein
MSRPQYEPASLWENFASLLRRWVSPRKPQQEQGAAYMSENRTPKNSSPGRIGSGDVPKQPRSSDPKTRFSELLGDWDGKLTEVLARVEAIERALFDQPGRLSNPSVTADDAADLTAIVRELFDVQQRSMVQQIAEQFSNSLVPQQIELQELRLEMSRLLTELRPDPAEEHNLRATPAAQSTWRMAIFGTLLMNDVQLTAQMDTLCDRIQAGDAAAALLAGQLMIFRNTVPERRPQLLKDVGEAFYRCFPKTEEGDDLFEQKIAEDLERMCDQAGFPNTIELVQPGQRFDSTRHMTDDRGGVEITQVHGWVVMRNQEKVYTKASVSAR